MPSQALADDDKVLEQNYYIHSKCISYIRRINICTCTERERERECAPKRYGKHSLSLHVCHSSKRIPRNLYQKLPISLNECIAVAYIPSKYELNRLCVDNLCAVHSRLQYIYVSTVSAQISCFDMAFGFFRFFFFYFHFLSQRRKES